MALFRNRRESGVKLPASIVSMMETLGPYEFDPQVSELDSGWVWTELQAPLMPLARADPDAFVTSLAAAVLPVGGWAVYGAAHTGYNLLETGFDHPEFDRLQSASLQFLRERGVPKSRVTGDEWQFWLSHQGKTEPWLVGAQAPRPEQRD